MSHFRILYIEDDDATRYAFGRYLQLRGYGVDYAQNGREGLAALHSHKYDAVIVDLMLNGVESGRSILKYLDRDSGASRPLIVVTTGDKGVIGLDQPDVADYVFFKPIDPERIVALFESSLQARREGAASSPQP